MSYTHPYAPYDTITREAEELGLMGKNEDRYLQKGWRANKGPQDSNKSGFRATGHRILLKPYEPKRTTDWGFELVDKTVTAEEQASVVAIVVEIGNDAWNDKANDFCQVGDKVLIGMYTGKFHVSPVDGIKYRFVQDLDIITPIIE